MLIIEIDFPWMMDGHHIADLEARISYDYSPGSKDYFCQSFGNWLPGDPPEIEVEDVELIGIDANRKTVYVPCPEYLWKAISDYAVLNHATTMADNYREAAYERQWG
jgi:hypothetical protein